MGTAYFVLLVYTYSKSRRFLRNIIAAHLEENRDQFIAYHEGDKESYQRHIDGIRNGAEWGGPLEIEVIQRVSNRPIIIVREDANPTIADNLETYAGDPIFVYYANQVHYDAFRFDGSITPREILDKIQAEMQTRKIGYL